MFHLGLTLPTPEQNLACDEALLDLCEEKDGVEILRFWEPSEYFVVVGYANKVQTEVNFSFCRQNDIPVLRRCTGGGTVLQGPGCLNYTLVLRVDGLHPLQNISATNDFVMNRHRETLTGLLGAKVEHCGHTDLAIGGLKFCGNAQRRHKRSLLFHGCFLLQLDIDLVAKALPIPSRQPDYRANRSHAAFLRNLTLTAEDLKAALIRIWGAKEELRLIPHERIELLVREKYERDEWNLRF
jgi:lipoate---protein ligase